MTVIGLGGLEVPFLHSTRRDTAVVSAARTSAPQRVKIQLAAVIRACEASMWGGEYEDGDFRRVRAGA